MKNLAILTNGERRVLVLRGDAQAQDLQGRQYHVCPDRACQYVHSSARALGGKEPFWHDVSRTDTLWEVRAFGPRHGMRIRQSHADRIARLFPHTHRYIRIWRNGEITEAPSSSPFRRLPCRPPQFWDYEWTADSYQSLSLRRTE